MLPKCCLPLKSQYSRGKCWLEKGRLLYWGAKQPGEKADLCLKINSEDSAQPWKFQKQESDVHHFGSGSVFIILHCGQTFFWFVGGEITGWCSRNLVLSLNLPSSIRLQVLDAAEEKKKKKKKILLCLFLEKEKGPCFIITLLVFFVVVVAPSLLLHFLPFLTSKCLHLTFGTKGRAKKLNEILSYKWDTEDMERFCTWEDHRVLLPFIASYIWESILIILWLYRVSYGKHSLWKSGWNISYLKITGLPVSVIMASLH